MATFNRVPAMPLTDPAWVEVSLRLTNMQLFEGRHQDIVEWIESDEVAGTAFFYHRQWADKRNPRLRGVIPYTEVRRGQDHVYVFDNPDSAFAFKLRWA